MVKLGATPLIGGGIMDHAASAITPETAARAFHSGTDHIAPRDKPKRDIADRRTSNIPTVTETTASAIPGTVLPVSSNRAAANPP